eukprot:156396-Pyramimonas_sp.AAC.1
MASAGVAAFAHLGVGLRGPVYPEGDLKARQSHTQSNISRVRAGPTRAQHVVIDAPGWPSFNLFNVHLHTAEGMSEKSAKILMTIGMTMAGQLSPCIIGGGWNMAALE